MDELDLLILEKRYEEVINKYINNSDENINILLELLNELFEEVKENVNDHCKASYNYGIVCAMYKMIDKL